MARRPASRNFRFTGEMPAAVTGAALREAAMSDLSREQNAEPVCWSEAQPASGHQRGERQRRTSSRTSVEAESRVARLARTIEAEIIPRLLLANSQAPSRAIAARGSRSITDADITTLVQIVLEQDTMGAVRHFERLESEGVPRETLFLDLLAPAARRLGDAWQDDTLSFAAVTIALSGLQQTLRHLSPQFEDRVGLRPHGRQVLLFNGPGEQHSFGLFMVEAFFRRTAWDVANTSGMPVPEIASMLRNNWFDVVGISKSTDVLLDDLASDITRLRRASRNKDLTILVGGPIFNATPELVIQVGADATGVDARQAVWQATKCVMALKKS
jgi:MerR family transcriptional regulator, light-induced transcriptional regulator